MTTKMIKGLTDEQLVLQYQKTQDSAIFGEIYNRYYKKIFHTCLGVVKNREVAYDLTQDVIMKVMENLAKLENGFLLGLWINRIARNASITYVRSQQKGNEAPYQSYYESLQEDADDDSRQKQENLLDAMDQVMNALKEEERQILIMRYFEKRSVEEVRKTLGLGGSATKMRLARARKRMLDLYEESMAAYA